ncbi:MULTISPECIES: hypothetical protein [Bacillales]|uniref:hypothetical protein n=1 Tax=Bacillales TaxID=1385 RepID=UPI001C8DE13A|nr:MULTISPECIES: hypothetical protein [Bacillales]MBY0222530.1 hypothetical protein [Sporosarcina aquimarina]WLF29246.1 hypothetical protein Q6357_12555 [Bacillus altitudinis]
MKEFTVSMTKRFVEIASKPIRTKKHVIMLMLEAIPLLTNADVLERPSNNYIILRVDKMKRLFFVIENKIFSFNFPFNVEVQEEKNNPIIYDSITDLELNALNLTVLKSAFEETFYGNENQGILDLDSELMQVIDSFDTKPNKDQVWQILKTLQMFESGYLRYDYDEVRENGKLHPLNHIDINYTSDGTFKIGINDTLDCNTFIDILDVNTDSYFISK